MSYLNGVHKLGARGVAFGNISEAFGVRSSSNDHAAVKKSSLQGKMVNAENCWMLISTSFDKDK